MKIRCPNCGKGPLTLPDGFSEIVACPFCNVEFDPGSQKDDGASEDELRRTSLTSSLQGLGCTPQATATSMMRLERILVEKKQAEQDQGPMAATNEARLLIVARAFDWPPSDVVRLEYGSPTGDSQGTFFCRKSDRFKAEGHDSPFWVEVVLPQQLAFRRLDLFSMIGGYPQSSWRVGPC